MNDDVLTRNDDEELAVRVVNSTEGSNPSTYDDVFTRDTNGKLAVRVVGAGGSGDSHNKGYFTTPAALREAYPTAEPGDFAIVESTDTVWVWDSDTNDWKDGDTKGQVTSVNNQTGAVTVQETLVSGTNIKTVDGNSLLGSGNLELSTYLPFPNTWTTSGTTKALCDDIAADTTATKGKAYLGEVTCSDLPGSMANAEIVVEIMDGSTSQDKVIVLTCTSGNSAPYMWKYTYWEGGTNVSGWQTWATSAQGAKADTAVQPGDLATVATTGAYSDLTGTPTIPAAIQVSTMPTAAVGELDKIYQFIGTTDANYTNGYFYKCVSDGQDPATYSWTQTDVQPQAGGLPSQTGQSGKFLTTDGTDASWSDKPLVNTFSDSTSVGILSYENRAYPRNVIIGTNIRYDASTQAEGDSVWIGDSVNHPSSTTYFRAPNSVIIGSKAAAESKSVVIGYKARGGATNYSTDSVCVGYQAGTSGGSSQVAVGYNSKAGYYSVAIGRESDAYTALSYQGAYCIAIGTFAKAKASGAIQIGNGTNSTEGTLQIGLSTGGSYGTTNQYVLLNSDGTIPEARLADTTNAQQGDVLTLDSNGNAVWQAGGGGSTAATGTLVAANWSSSSQTINVTGVTASNNVIVAPAPASQADYTAAGIICTAQGAGTLTFTATTTPSSDIVVTVLIV